jgi:hypothetical protein
VTPQDSKRTKRALNRLGYLKTPEWGLTGYPTEDMFDGPGDVPARSQSSGPTA